MTHWIPLWLHRLSSPPTFYRFAGVVEVGIGLIEQPQGGRQQQQAGQRGALLLSGGEAPGRFVFVSAQADFGQCVGHCRT
jgi:hypothetical protein